MPRQSNAARQNPQSNIDLHLYSKWETFTVKDGLPSDKAFAIRIDDKRIWVGTANGLALYEKGEWRSFSTDDGLPHPAVLSLDVSSRTGDLWIGTMGGLARFSGGRFDIFTQLNSGLPNDFVNSVRCDPDKDYIWVATAMGAGRLDLQMGEWTIYTHKNTPMHEPWTYSVSIGKKAVYIGAWGAGIIEYTKATGRWREYRDPDKEFEIDLFPDDGPVHDVTAGVDFGKGILWQATYSGAARYDGREWRSYFSSDSGLASDFINFVRSQGRQAWFATDHGLSLTDGNAWATYLRLHDGQGEVRFFNNGAETGRRLTPTAIAHNFVLGIDTMGDEVWVATEKGVSKGIRSLQIDIPSKPRIRAGGTAPPSKRFPYARTPDALQPYGNETPYRYFFTDRTGFMGAGRQEPEPDGLKEILIGFIGSLKNHDPHSQTDEDHKAMSGQKMLQGATLAVEEANADNGYKGIPFKLVPRIDFILWGQSSSQLVRFAYRDKVWAVLSGIDSNHNHVLSRASLKIEIPIVNAGSTDPTLVEHNVPWLIRCINDDRQNAYALLNEIYVVRNLKRIALIRVSGRDGRVGVVELVQGARRLGSPIVIEQRFSSGETDFHDQLTRIQGSSPDGLVIWSDPHKAGLIVRQMRKMGIDIPIFGFDRMARADFLKAAGDAAEGVVVTASMNPESDNPMWRKFANHYQKRWGKFPETLAAHAYDGMNLIIKAIRNVGLNRVHIRDFLFSLKNYHGVTGEIIFDTNMNDVGTPWLAVVKENSFHYYPAGSWPKGKGSR